MGRGIFILDAITGDLVWSAKPAASGTTSCSTTQPYGCQVAGMNYSIPADLALMDRDIDGKIERLYAVDAGGNIWRVDLETADGNTPDKWRVSQLAALGCDTGACSSGSARRKFLYPPDVVPVGVAGAANSYDAVLLGSGDREHPLYSSATNSAYSVRNRFFMVKDFRTSKNSPAQATVTMTNLVDASSGVYDGSKSGYYFSFGTGEQSVNASLTIAGYTYFGTNQPSPPSPNQCTADLGIARGYKVETLTGAHTYTLFKNGGLPPSPVAGLVNMDVNGHSIQVPFAIGTGDPNCTSADCLSPLGGVKPPINVNTKRSRTYWYNK
jgi:type IV pilus assembly protein PilY1